MKPLNAEGKQSKNEAEASKVLEKAKSIALRYLSYRNRSKKEMSDHLEKNEFDSKTIAETLRYLIRLDYINDGRFALNWGKFLAKNKRFGKRRVLWELIHKGISSSLAEEITTQIFSEFDEWESARTCSKKKSNHYTNVMFKQNAEDWRGILSAKGSPPLS